MKRATWTFTLLSTLFAGPALLADGADGADRFDHDRYGYDDHGYNNDRCPRPDQMGRVEALADDVAGLAAEIHERAERNNRRPDPHVARVLGDLHDLADASAHFEREVAARRRDPRHTRDDFQQLLLAFDQVGRSLRDIDTRSYIDRGMERIGGLLAQLDDYYGYGYGDRYSPGRRGRFGSDRYGRYPGRGGWRPDRNPVSFEIGVDFGQGRGYGRLRVAP
jgi:hypothetical protein